MKPNDGFDSQFTNFSNSAIDAVLASPPSKQSLVLTLQVNNNASAREQKVIKVQPAKKILVLDYDMYLNFPSWNVASDAVAFATIILGPTSNYYFDLERIKNLGWMITASNLPSHNVLDISAGQWHHIQMKYDGSKAPVLFTLVVDGTTFASFGLPVTQPAPVVPFDQVTLNVGVEAQNTTPAVAVHYDNVMVTVQ